MKFPYKTIRDIDVQDKQILIREGYDLPINPDGTIADDFRVTSSLPTLKYLLERGAKIVIIAHLGRPKNGFEQKFSLAPAAPNLAKHLGRPVKFINDCIGDAVSVATKKMASGEVILLENLRFHPEEKANDPNFAKQLAKDSHASIFVQDSFSNVHHGDASMVAITEFLPSVAGLLVEREYSEIKSATDDPNRPLTAVMGGAKISDKIPLIEKFIDIADNIIVGGAMANNFLKFMGHNIADSLIEPDIDETVKNILDKARAKFGADFEQKFQIPIDVAISENGDMYGKRVDVSVEKLSDIKPESKILDLGDETIENAVKVIEKSGTVIWNGTVGYAENPEFAHGSARIAMALASNPHITSVIGGGDTADFVRNWDALNGGSFTHVSTGGGASLELMAGDIMPGIVALMSK